MIRGYHLLFLLSILWVNLGAYAQSNQDLDSLFKVARTKAFEGDRQGSVFLLDQIIAQKSDHFDARLMRARVYSWDKRFEEASQECQTLNKDFPEAASVYVLWSTIERWSEQPEMAKAVCLRGLNKFPGDRQIILELSRALPMVEEAEQSLMLNDSSIRKYPDALPEQKNKINTLMLIDSLDSALFVCDSLILQYSDDKELRIIRGKCKAAVNWFDSALVETDTVFGMDSAYLPAHHLRTNLYLWKDSLDSAIWSANEGLELFEGDVPLELMLAKAFLRLDSFPPCDSLVELVLAEDSLHYGAWSIGLNSQLAQSNYDSVLTATGELLKGPFPEDPELKRLRVLSFAGKKKYRDAIEELASSVEEADSLDAGSKVLYTKFHYWDRQTTKALNLADRFIEQHPDEIELYRIKALVQKSWYQKKKALATLDTALAKDSTNTDLIELQREIQENMYLNYVALYAGYDQWYNHSTSAFGLTRLTAEYFRQLNRHSVIARISSANRFDSTGYQVEVDGYLVATDWLYFYLNAGWSTEFLFPWRRASIEPFVNLPFNLELSYGLRYMEYSNPANQLFIWTGSVGTYPGNWWFSFDLISPLVDPMALHSPTI